MRPERYNSQENPFKCGICNIILSRKSYLKAHITEVHEGENTFECEYCDGNFTSRKGLAYHIKTTHEEVEEITNRRNVNKEPIFPIKYNS